jgi:hypothetical protein
MSLPLSPVGLMVAYLNELPMNSRKAGFKKALIRELPFIHRSAQKVNSRKFPITDVWIRRA